MFAMPTGLSGVTKMAAMTELTEMTEAQLEKEFKGRGEDDERQGEGEKGKREPGRDGGKHLTPSFSSSSSDRPISSDSRTTGFTQSVSDQSSEDRGKPGDNTMPDSQGNKRKNSAHGVWQSVKKAGAELNRDTRRVFRHIGRKLNSRNGTRETKVKEIHILPGEDDDRMWARRLAGSGSAHSYSSSSSDPST